MKLLFLDHDGVICLYNDWGKRTENSLDPDECFDPFDKKAVAILNQIIQITGCEIVVSSDWRFRCSLEEMGEMYVKRGILKKPVGYTTLEPPKKPSEFVWDKSSETEQGRAQEILQYVSERDNIESWVAVDDLDMRKHIVKKSRSGTETETRDWGLENFVWAKRPNEGIKQTGVLNKIVCILNGSQKK